MGGCRHSVSFRHHQGLEEQKRSHFYKMKFFILASLATAVLGSTVPILPAGVNPADCPPGTYPYCGREAPAALPTPVINGQPVAPVLNTVPEQTLAYQQAQLVKAPAALPTPIVNGQPVAPVLNTVPEQTLAYQQAQLVRSPANFPQPIINDEPVAPGLNTVPAQTRAHENHQLIAQQQQLEQLKAQQIIQIRQQQQEIEAAKHFGRL